jgi:serine protease inhibitor
MKIKIAITLLSLLGSNTSFAAEQGISEQQLQTSTTLNQLGADFLHAKLKQSELSNAMVSPVSLYYALSILQQGANLHSKHLLNSLLLNDPTLQLNDIAPALAEKIVAAKREDYPHIAHFQLANSIWSTNGQSTAKPFYFAEQFQNNAASFYNASHYSVDFVTEGAGLINNWASDKTNGLIPEIIDALTLKQFVWVIMNAAYFEGAWGTPMKAIAENPSYTFQTIHGESIEAKSIATKNYKAPVLEKEDGSIAFRIPFSGGKYSFIAYLPPDSEVAIAQWLLDKGSVDMPNVIDAVVNNKTQPFQLTIQLPSFSFSDGIELKKGSAIANDLGLSPLFSKQVDLSLLVDKDKTPIANQDTKVGLIKQNTKIELDENGVKAAAVTLVAGIAKTSMPRPLPRRSIVVDRPFAFAIIENKSRAMLFNGVLTHPSLL